MPDSEEMAQGRNDDDDDRDALDWLFHELDYLMSRIRRLTLLILLVTLLNVVLTVVAFAVGYSARSDGDYDYTLPYAGLFAVPYSLVVVTALFFIWSFEGTRRTADAMFDELSDVLQRDLANPAKNPARQSIDSKAALRERVLLREYRLARNLPFVNGPNGAGLYILFNLILIFVSMLGLFVVSS